MSIEDRTFYSIETPLLLQSFIITYFQPELVELGSRIQLNARDGEGELAIVETFDMVLNYSDAYSDDYIGLSENGYVLEIGAIRGPDEYSHGVCLYSPDYFEEISSMAITDGVHTFDDLINGSDYGLSTLLLDGFDLSTSYFNVSAQMGDIYSEPTVGYCYNWSDTNEDLTVLALPEISFAESRSSEEDIRFNFTQDWGSLSRFLGDAPTWDEILEFFQAGNRYHLKFDFFRPVNKVEYGEEVVVDLTDSDYPLADASEVAGEYSSFIDKSGVIMTEAIPDYVRPHYEGDLAEVDLIGRYYFWGYPAYVDSISVDIATLNALGNRPSSHIAPGFRIANKTGSEPYSFSNDLTNMTQYTAGGYRRSNLIVAIGTWYGDGGKVGVDICGMYGGEYTSSVRYMGNHQVRAYATAAFVQEFDENDLSTLRCTTNGNPGIIAAPAKLNSYVVRCYPIYI